MDSFVNRANIKGIMQIMDQNKIKGIRNVEDKFFNEEKIQQYEDLMDQLDAKLQELNDEVQEFSHSENSEAHEIPESHDQVSKSIIQSENLSSVKVSNDDKQTIFKSLIDGPMRIDDQIENILNRQNGFQTQQQQIIQPSLQRHQSESKIQHSLQQNSIFDKDEILEEIQDLVDTLTNEGIKERDLPQYSRNTSYKDLKLIKQQLMKKWKKLYSRGIIEDVILMSVKGLETVFDGKTSVLGFSPNLQGFSNTVMMGVKQHRSEMSRVVENVCASNGIGVRDKFIIKIITSAIKRNILNKSANNAENHSQHMRQILQHKN